MGDIGDRPDDVVILGKCDDVCQRLCKLLTWEEELDTLWETTKDSLDPKEDIPELLPLDVEEEVQKLAEEVKKSLEVSATLKESVEKIGKRDGEVTPPDKEGPVMERTGSQETVVTKTAVDHDTDLTETLKQDADAEDSRRPDTRHEPAVNAGDTKDPADLGKFGKL